MTLDKYKIDILGTEYILTLCNKREDKRLKDCDGLCDNSIKEIVVNDYGDAGDDPLNKGDLYWQMNKNMRHEVIHAFLYESGLAENSDWAQNEEMIDFFALQLPKIIKAMNSELASVQ